MKWNKVQLMLHGHDVGNAAGYTLNYPGVKIKINKVENKNYVFLDLIISTNAKTGNSKKKGTGNNSVDFELSQGAQVME